MFDPAIRPKRRAPWLTLMLACVAVATVLALPGAARADIAPPPRGGNGGGSSVAGSNGTAGAAARIQRHRRSRRPDPTAPPGRRRPQRRRRWVRRDPVDQLVGLRRRAARGGMIGVGLAAFFWSRSRRPQQVARAAPHVVRCLHRGVAARAPRRRAPPVADPGRHPSPARRPAHRAGSPGGLARDRPRRRRPRGCDPLSGPAAAPRSDRLRRGAPRRRRAHADPAARVLPRRPRRAAGRGRRADRAPPRDGVRPGLRRGTAGARRRGRGDHLAIALAARRSGAYGRAALAFAATLALAVVSQRRPDAVFIALMRRPQPGGAGALRAPLSPPLAAPAGAAAS